MQAERPKQKTALDLLSEAARELGITPRQLGQKTRVPRRMAYEWLEGLRYPTKRQWTMITAVIADLRHVQYEQEVPEELRGQLVSRKVKESPQDVPESRPSPPSTPPPSAPISQDIFGLALRAARDEAGFTTEEMCELIEVSDEEVYSRWESGLLRPNRVVFSRILGVFPQLEALDLPWAEGWGAQLAPVPAPPRPSAPPLTFKTSSFGRAEKTDDAVITPSVPSYLKRSIGQQAVDEGWARAAAASANKTEPTPEKEEIPESKPKSAAYPAKAPAWLRAGVEDGSRRLSLDAPPTLVVLPKGSELARHLIEEPMAAQTKPVQFSLPDVLALSRLVAAIKSTPVSTQVMELVEVLRRSGGSLSDLQELLK